MSNQAQNTYVPEAGTLTATGNPISGARAPRRVFPIREYGAANDGVTILDAAMTSGSASLSSATAAFAAGDAGKHIVVTGAGVGGGDLIATISSVTNATTVTLSVSASTTVSDTPADYGSDETAAVQAAIDAAVAAGGGRVVGENRLYMIAGAFGTATGGDAAYSVGQIKLPALSLSDDEGIAVELCGEFPPVPNINWTTDNQPITRKGMILRSVGVPAQPWHAVITGGPKAGEQWTLSAIHFMLRNLIVRTYQNPAVSAVNLGWVGMATVNNVVIDTGSNLSGITEPTNAAFGLVMPQTDNWVVSRARAVDAIGYKFGLQFSEHFNGDDLRFWKCGTALRAIGTNHVSRIGKVMVVACPRGLAGVGPGSHRLTIESYGTEHTSLGDWTDRVYDVDDADNILRGRIDFGSVQSNVGPGPTALINGAENVRIRNLVGAASGTAVANTTTLTQANGVYQDVTDALITLPGAGDYVLDYTATCFIIGSGVVHVRLYDVTADAPVGNSELQLLYVVGGNQTGGNARSKSFRASGETQLRLQAARSGTFSDTNISSDTNGRTVLSWRRA